MSTYLYSLSTSTSWLAVNLRAHAVLAAQVEFRVVFLLDLPEPAVVGPAPEAFLPLAVLQGVLGLVEVGGVAVPVEDRPQAEVHPVLLLIESESQAVRVDAEVKSLVAGGPEAGGDWAAGVVNRFPVSWNEWIEVVDWVPTGTRVVRKLVAVGLP